MNFKEYLLTESSVSFASYVVVKSNNKSTGNDKYSDVDFGKDVKQVVSILKTHNVEIGDNESDDDDLSVELYDIKCQDSVDGLQKAFQAVVDSVEVTISGTLYYMKDGEQSDNGYRIKTTGGKVTVKSI